MIQSAMNSYNLLQEIHHLKIGNTLELRYA